MCAGGTRDAGGSGGSAPPAFGCPSQGGARVSAWECVFQPTP